MREAKVLLVGPAGHGKSSIINLIVGGNVRPVDDFQSGVRRCGTITVRIKHRYLTMIDTTGFNGNFNDDKNSARAIVRQIRANKNLRIVFVWRLDETRVGASDFSFLSHYRKSINKHSISNRLAPFLIFTFQDKVQENINNIISERINILQEQFRNLLEIDSYEFKKVALVQGKKSSRERVHGVRKIEMLFFSPVFNKRVEKFC